MDGEVLVYPLLLERRKTLDAREVKTWQNLGVSRRAGLFICSLLKQESWTALSEHRVYTLL